MLSRSSLEEQDLISAVVRGRKNAGEAGNLVLRQVAEKRTGQDGTVATILSQTILHVARQSKTSDPCKEPFRFYQSPKGIAVTRLVEPS
jgi:hypothetical protein